MIELSRALARQFRAAVRKSVLAADPRGPCPVVLCTASRRGLVLSCRQGNIGVRHHTPGSFPASAAALPFSKWVELEAKGEAFALEELRGHLAAIPWSGRATLTGRVHGPYENPRIEASASVKDLRLEHLSLGDVSANVGMANFVLLIEEVRGRKGRSSYSGR